MAKGDICQIENCEKLVLWGKVCSAHYARKWRHGNYEHNPNWPNLKKGQALPTKLGYLRININGKRMLHHRHIMEQHLGRKLEKGERIHHKNGIKTDNRIENLKLIDSQSSHISKHHPKKPLIDWTRIKIPKGKANRWHPHKCSNCLIKGCEEPPKKKCLCIKHYISYRHNFLKK